MSVVPNFGRPDGRPGPVGLWNYPDTQDISLTVNLVVIPARGSRATSRDSRWMLTWDVAMTGSGQIAQRRCCLNQEAGFHHLTSWGSITVAVNVNENDGKVVIPLKNLSLSKRQYLESIANATLVRYSPNGDWNSQNWCIAILETACQQRIFSDAEVAKAIDYAQRIPAFAH